MHKGMENQRIIPNLLTLLPCIYRFDIKSPEIKKSYEMKAK